MARGDTTEVVREVAARRVVSERTVWRWFAAMRASGDSSLLGQRDCRYCGRELPAAATIRRQYCDAICRVYAHRRTRARERFAAGTKAVIPA